MLHMRVLFAVVVDRVCFAAVAPRSDGFRIYFSEIKSLPLCCLFRVIINSQTMFNFPFFHSNPCIFPNNLTRSQSDEIKTNRFAFEFKCAFPSFCASLTSSDRVGQLLSEHIVSGFPDNIEMYLNTTVPHEKNSHSP